MTGRPGMGLAQRQGRWVGVMPAHVTAKDLVFTCTGLGTHDKAETTVTVWPVTAGHPAGTWKWPAPNAGGHCGSAGACRTT
jgi:hypothetical protein